MRSDSQRNPLGIRLQASAHKSRRIVPTRPISSWSPGDKNLTWSLNLSRQDDSKEALRTCPAWVFQRVNLRDLKISGNSIREMSENLLQLQHLHVLRLDSNMLVELPTALRDLYCLQILDVSDNKLSELGKGTALPPGLIEANFSQNFITSLPEQMLARSRMLQVLNLSQNQLRSLPSVDWPVALPNLEHLDLMDNRLSEIAGSKILSIPNLCSFDLSNNKLLDLALFQDKASTGNSHVQAFSTRLSSLECSGNPLTFPPPEIIKSGGAWTAEYLRCIHLCARVHMCLCTCFRLQTSQDPRRLWGGERGRGREISRTYERGENRKSGADRRKVEREREGFNHKFFSTLFFRYV